MSNPEATPKPVPIATAIPPVKTEATIIIPTTVITPAMAAKFYQNSDKFPLGSIFIIGLFVALAYKFMVSSSSILINLPISGL
jgi:hypothetical protein